MADNQRFNMLSSAPLAPIEGETYYDTTLGQLGIYNGSAWDYYLTVVPAASGSVVGGIKLTQDLGGSDTSPEVVGIQGKTIDAPTTKGDLFVYDGTALKRLAVGSDGNVLTARASASDGVDWEAGGGSSFTEIDGNLTLGGKTVAATPPTSGGPFMLIDSGTEWIAESLTLHAIAAAIANDGDVALNSHKLTGVANGSASDDAAAFGQILEKNAKSRLTRVIGTAYQESTTRPALVTVGIDTGIAAGPGWGQVQTGSTSSLGTELSDVYSASTRVVLPVTFIVDPGEYWGVLVASGSPVIFGNKATVSIL